MVESTFRKHNSFRVKYVPYLQVRKIRGKIHSSTGVALVHDTQDAFLWLEGHHWPLNVVCSHEQHLSSPSVCAVDQLSNQSLPSTYPELLLPTRSKSWRSPMPAALPVLPHDSSGCYYRRTEHLPHLFLEAWRLLTLVEFCRSQELFSLLIKVWDSLYKPGFFLHWFCFP